MNGHFFTHFSHFFYLFFFGYNQKDEYIEVLKKNAFECGERTLLAFSDQQGEHEHMQRVLWKRRLWRTERARTARPTQNKMNVVWQRRPGRQAGSQLAY